MQNKTTATIRGVQRVEEDNPLDSHWKIVVSLEWGGLRNVTIIKSDDDGIFVNNNEAPMSNIRVKDIRFIVETAIKHFDSEGEFPLVVASKHSLAGVNR